MLSKTPPLLLRFGVLGALPICLSFFFDGSGFALAEAGELFRATPSAVSFALMALTLAHHLPSMWHHGYPFARTLWFMENCTYYCCLQFLLLEFLNRGHSSKGGIVAPLFGTEGCRAAPFFAWATPPMQYVLAQHLALDAVWQLWRWLEYPRVTLVPKVILCAVWALTVVVALEGVPILFAPPRAAALVRQDDPAAKALHLLFVDRDEPPPPQQAAPIEEESCPRADGAWSVEGAVSDRWGRLILMHCIGFIVAEITHVLFWALRRIFTYSPDSPPDLAFGHAKPVVHVD